MKIQEYLNKVAYIDKSKIEGDNEDVYYSKFDNSYITRVGMEKNVKHLADREITDQLTHGVGFSPKDNKWYGWSHRAIYGFEIGSTCKKGDVHYTPATVEDALEDALSFWSDEDHTNIKAEVLDDNRIKISWIYSKTIPNKKLRGERSTVIQEYVLGKGEWTAETMEDAKQMAIDFCEGVS